MGIKHFFYWFKTEFPEHIIPVRGEPVQAEVDNLMIDMNGIFHSSAQKIYQYGNHAPPPRMMNNSRRRIVQSTYRSQLRLFEDVCATVESLLWTVRPSRRVVLCVDGPAPISKQNQQRQRRFRSARDASPDAPFDSNSITPGTKFMDYLTKYIDWYIRKRITEDPAWRSVQVIFSNEKAPGEGEHKIVNYIRRYGDPRETYCINGMDADLIMLALGTHLPKFYILREDSYTPSNDYYCIDIGAIRLKLMQKMDWRTESTLEPDRIKPYIGDRAIDDFIFMCFTVGNDFLPHIPSIEIIENGIDLILTIYRTVGETHGHLTHLCKDGSTQFIPSTLTYWLSAIGAYEKSNFESKMEKQQSFFPDETLQAYTHRDRHGKVHVDIERYIDTYCRKLVAEARAHNPANNPRPVNSTEPLDRELRAICHAYLEGMQWVLSYYKRGVPNWTWCFPYHYAPPASVLARYCDSFKFPQYTKTEPSLPFLQLLSVLPPRSATLIPSPLDRLLTHERSPLQPYCPTEFPVDLAGKRKDWEGIVILPMVNMDTLRRAYFANLPRVDSRESRRNVTGKSVVYSYTPHNPLLFKSHYGNIENCTVTSRPIEL